MTLLFVYIKGSREDLFMLLFFRLIIFHESFCNIETKIFELLVREISMLHSVLLTFLSQAKWQGCFLKGTRFTSTHTNWFCFTSHIMSWDCHCRLSLHFLWAMSTHFILLILSTLSHYFLFFDRFSLMHNFLISYHRSANILTIDGVSLWSNDSFIIMILESRSFSGIWILLWLQVLANFIFFWVLCFCYTGSFSWRLLRWSKRISRVVYTIHIRSAIDNFRTKSPWTTKWAGNSSC